MGRKLLIRLCARQAIFAASKIALYKIVYSLAAHASILAFDPDGLLSLLAFLKGEIYQRASDARRTIKVIVFFKTQELKRVQGSYNG
jgi:hypothetical protein